MRRAKIIIILGAVIALLGSVGVAMATTGATTGYPQPKVVVPSSVSAPYEQRYVLTAVGSGAGAHRGQHVALFVGGGDARGDDHFRLWVAGRRTGSSHRDADAAEQRDHGTEDDDDLCAP